MTVSSSVHIDNLFGASNSWQRGKTCIGLGAISIVVLLQLCYQAIRDSKASKTALKTSDGISNLHSAEKTSNSSELHQFTDIDLHPPIGHPSHCYLVNMRRSFTILPKYSFNSRSFCLTSAMCIETVSLKTEHPKLYFSAALQNTQCSNVTASFREEDESSDCPLIQSYVHCAHGRYDLPFEPACPSVLQFSDLQPKTLESATWLPGIVAIVPAISHQGNIFHFSFILGMTSHLLAALPNLWKSYQALPEKATHKIPVTLLFRGESPEALGKWQAGLIEAIVNFRLLEAGLNISMVSLNEYENESTPSLICARSSLLMGRRSAINIWPFPSVQYPSLDGDEVPLESIAFRHAVYKAMRVETNLPSVVSGSFDSANSQITFDLPPLVIGYASRNSEHDAPKGEQQVGPIRRFSDADEQWFVSMLNKEAGLQNMTVTNIQISSETGLEKQVHLFSNAGFVVGIHGANLMNTIFMKPFGGMLEIFPSYRILCYTAGANSGISHSSYFPLKVASAEESGCIESWSSCNDNALERRVLISEKEDRTKLRALVKDGIARIRSLHERFGRFGGVPVVYDEELSVFRIDWRR